MAVNIMNSLLQCEVIHRFREVNAVVDSLPRYSITGNIDKKYSLEEDLPNTTTWPMRMNKPNLASFRLTK